MKRDDVAWLAGLFEGEGTLHRRKDGGGYELVIAMCDEDVVRRCQEVTGLGTVIHIDRSHQPGWRDLYRWRVGRRADVLALVEAIRPFMGERRAATLDEFVEWYEAGHPTRRTDEQRAASAAYMRKWRAERAVG